jgi:secondary thiamine-phosphate synthase enzyme
VSTFDTQIPIRTGGRHALVNVTAELSRAVANSGVQTGIACASVPHTTCALIVNEDEPGLREDILRLMDEVVFPLGKKKPFAHDRVDNNAAAHLTSLFFQPSLAVPIVDGQIRLGTWQSLFLVELDGPRRRTLRVSIVGD